MVNIGFLGAVSVGKTSLLRLFVKYTEENKLGEIKGGKDCIITNIDFSGEAILEKDIEKENKETKTIHPNRIFFKDGEANRNHTLFAPGGDKDRAVVKMGIITISRIAKQIIAIFSLDRPLKEQLEFFDTIRYFPKKIYACFNKFDLMAVKPDRMDSEVKHLKSDILSYFKKRKIEVADYFFTCAEINDNNKIYNDNAAKMILQIAIENSEPNSGFSRPKTAETTVSI